MEQFEKIQNSLTGQYLIPNILVWTSQVVTNDSNENKYLNYLVLVYDGENDLDEEIFTKIYDAYYKYLIDNGLDPKSPSNRSREVYIQSFYVTGGLEFTLKDQNDLFDAMLNMIPTYVRHYYTIPTRLYDMPRNISTNTYTIPTGVVDNINKMIGKMVVQKNVPRKLKQQFNLIKKGTVEININESIQDMPPYNFKIHYQLNDDNFKIISNVKNNFKVEGIVSLTAIRPVILEAHEKELVTGWRLNQAWLDQIKKRLQLHKIKLEVLGTAQECVKYNN